MDDDAQRKRLKIRSWRRGIKEMDLILGPFADSELSGLSAPDLDLYEVLLDENDHDLYAWITARLRGERPGPDAMLLLLDKISAFAQARLNPGPQG